MVGSFLWRGLGLDVPGEGPPRVPGRLIKGCGGCGKYVGLMASSMQTSMRALGDFASEEKVSLASCLLAKAASLALDCSGLSVSVHYAI